MVKRSAGSCSRNAWKHASSDYKLTSECDHWDHWEDMAYETTCTLEGCLDVEVELICLLQNGLRAPSCYKSFQKASEKDYKTILNAEPRLSATAISLLQLERACDPSKTTRIRTWSFRILRNLQEGRTVLLESVVSV